MTESSPVAETVAGTPADAPVPVDATVPVASVAGGVAPGASAAAPTAGAAAPPRPLYAVSSADRLDLLGNIEMDVTAELGRTRMPVRQLLSLTPGALVELDKTAGSPVDLLVNGTLIARGEVVVIDEEFGIRISEIVEPPAESGR